VVVVDREGLEMVEAAAVVVGDDKDDDDKGQKGTGVSGPTGGESTTRSSRFLTAGQDRLFDGKDPLSRTPQQVTLLRAGLSVVLPLSVASYLFWSLWDPR